MLSFETIDSKRITLLIRDLLNNAYKYSLIEYVGEPQDAPDLWQGFPDSSSERIACEIKLGNISQFNLLNDFVNSCNSQLNARQYDKFIIVILRELNLEERKRLNQDINKKSLKDLFIFDANDLRKLVFENPNVACNYFPSFNTWHETYKHVANLLADFYNNNQSTPAESIYKKLENTDYYKLNSGRIFQYDTTENINGLDPIQIYASFNYTGIRNDSRIKNINYLLLALDSEIILKDDVQFHGIPSPIITQIIYNRKIDIQNEVWHTFYHINKFGLEGLDEDHYDSYNKWYGIGLTAFTIFLFWTNSDLFIPLDQNTSTFIVGLKIVDSIPKSHKDYLSLCNRINNASDTGNIRLIVKEAYDFVPKGSNQPSEQLVQLLRKLLPPTDVKVALEDFRHYSSQNFKIIALRPTKCGEQNKKAKLHQKNLIEDTIYPFHDSYKILEDDIIKYIPGSEEYLYNEDNLRISISSIVGENGSGKSTLMELLILAINKLSRYAEFSESKSLIDEDVFVDLFIKTDFIYKISINETVKIWRYTYDEENFLFTPKYLLVSDSDVHRFDFKSFFYTIVSNYSLYSFNSNIIGDWIDLLFDKNDGYQIPIVLNPKRQKGIVNINQEEGLSNSRLLANILEPDKRNIEQRKVSALVNNKRPVSLVLTLNQNKRDSKREKYLKRKELTPEDKASIESVFKLFDIENIAISEAADDVKEYIYFKLVSMSGYEQFSDYREIYSNGNFDKERLPQYIKAVLNEKSHISFKIKQAINILKYGHFKIGSNDAFISASLIGEIQRRAFEQSETVNIKTIELIPPSVFTNEIIFEEPFSFESLSSGEKQQILSIVGITYHLTNLDSIIEKNGLISYSNVNVVFDEVELYFHPEMQRKYLNDLRDNIVNLRLENIKNINIIFVTHSPFILSDIPTSNLLKLKNGEPQVKEGQTFGANIYDLLKDSFFLSNGPMGEYAKEKINSTIDWLNNKERNLSEKEYHKEIIYLIGEPILQRKLAEMFDQVTMEKTSSEILRKKIALLEDELKKIEE